MTSKEQIMQFQSPIHIKKIKAQEDVIHPSYNEVSSFNSEVLLDTIAKLEALEKVYTKALSDLKKKTDAYPTKRLYCCRHKNGYQYYVQDSATDGKMVYHNVSKPIVRALAQRDYNKQLETKLEKNLAAIHRLQSNLKHNDLLELYSSSRDGLKRLIFPLFVYPREYEDDWENAEYQKKEVYTSGLVQVTDKGEQVRSKSEVLIANALKKFGIKYKYECPLLLDGFVIHPDFTILNPKTGKIIYWEHLGMVDEQGYRDDALKRVQTYESNGYKLGTDVIITAETYKYPINVRKIEDTIKMYIM